MHGTVAPNLSDRERAIIQAVSAGRSNAEIAQELDLRLQTIKNGISRILRKVQRENRVQLALWAATELNPPAPDAAAPKEAQEPAAIES
jgi:DNA-binding NarL/FixJ family response regulator